MNSKETITICGSSVKSERPIVIGVKGGVINWVKEKKEIKSVDIGDEATIIAPLLFDIQVNGGFGISIQDENLTEEKLVELTQRLLKIGVARWVPTIVSNSIEKTEYLCRIIGNAIQNNKELSYAIPGIHLEGPWISAEDGPRGAHAKEYVSEPSIKEFEKYYKSSGGKIIYVTLAPEKKNAISFIRFLKSRGINVALGHHNADISTLQKAVEAGATLCTHLGNGIQNYIHRHNNPLWYSLAEDKLFVSVIADGHHLPPAVLRVIAKCKGKNRVILVSDATQFMGMRPGVYKEFGAEVELKKDGKLCLKGTPYLAGSACSLLDCISVWKENTLNSWYASFQSASLIPAKWLQVKMPGFQINSGTKANFICVKINKENEKLIPVAVFWDGKVFMVNRC